MRSRTRSPDFLCLQNRCRDLSSQVSLGLKWRNECRGSKQCVIVSITTTSVSLLPFWPHKSLWPFPAERHKVDFSEVYLWSHVFPLPLQKNWKKLEEWINRSIQKESIDSVGLLLVYCFYIMFSLSVSINIPVLSGWIPVFPWVLQCFFLNWF